MAEKRNRKRWPVQDAKSRFSELLEASLTRGPQIVTRRGVEMAVLVRVDQWRQLEGDATRPSLKDLLLASSPRAEIPVPPRRARRRREPSVLDESGREL